MTNVDTTSIPNWPFAAGSKVWVKRSRKLTGVVVGWKPDADLVEVKTDSGGPNRHFRSGELDAAS